MNTLFSDVWILKDAYPLPIHTGSVLGSDGVGVVEKTSGDGSIKKGQRVLINPGIGWDTDPLGPEEDYYILGLLPAIGMYVCVCVVCCSMHTLFG